MVKQSGTPRRADDSRQWLGSPPPPSVVVLDLWPFLYNMWVFFLFFLHHSSFITLASRRAAVRFGLGVIDGPLSLSHQSPINHALRSSRTAASPRPWPRR